MGKFPANGAISDRRSPDRGVVSDRLLQFILGDDDMPELDLSFKLLRRHPSDLLRVQLLE